MLGIGTIRCIFAENLDETAERNPIYGISCLANFFTKHSRRKTKTKFVHSHTAFFGNQKMPQFMDKNQRSQHNDKYNKVHFRSRKFFFEIIVRPRRFSNCFLAPPAISPPVLASAFNFGMPCESSSR